MRRLVVGEGGVGGGRGFVYICVGLVKVHRGALDVTNSIHCGR